MKVFWLFNHPAPYKVDMFNCLGEKCDLFVLFERSKEKCRNNIFYGEEKRFHYSICKGLKWGLMNSLSNTPIDYLKKEKYDCIVINGWRTLTEMNALRYLKKHNIPYIFAINGGIVKEKENWLIKKIKTKYIKGAASYLCPDAKSKEYLIHYGAKSEDIHFFHYSSIFAKDIIAKPLEEKEKIESRKGIAKVNEKVFVSSGQLIRRKNFIELINVWKDLPTNYKLFICGEGKLKKKIERIIKTEKLENIKLLPYQKKKDLLHLFSIADGFIFLSKEDIYGHVINEALSQGLPVISSNKVNASLNLIKDGYNGYTVNLENEDYIIEKIKDEKLLTMANNCIETAKKNTIEQSAIDTLETIEEFIKRK